MTLTEQFEDAQQRIHGLASRPSNDTLLELYGLYKQATGGDVQGKRPGILDPKRRAKFDAWTARRGMGREDAMQKYVGLVNRLCGC
jgi:diazepam-binding inhibitor (GABA receptor modulator, acyl-CoA-binding protein)